MFKQFRVEPGKKVKGVGDAAAPLAAAGAPIARAEGFDVHAESMEARVGENPPS